MPAEEVILTVEGLKKLEKELQDLKTIKRREVAERIKQAIEFGDISENSEYEDAKNEQAFMEGRILTLEKKLRHARVIDDTQNNGEIVALGSRVKIKDLQTGDEDEYVILGSMETDPDDNKISNESPVGKAILGRAKGDIFEVNVPMGVVAYQIVDIIV